MSNDALIRELAAGLTPVRPRNVPREIAGLTALCAIELALMPGLGLMRPDMGRMIGTGYMLWKLGSLAALAAISCLVAVRSFSPPGSPRRGLGVIAALALAVMLAGAAFGPMPTRAAVLLARLSPAHGMLCALSIVVLSLPVMAMLAVLMRRGAPAHPEGSAVASGLAAGTCGALVFALCCPVNDPLYIVVWYAAGCTAVTLAARWLLPRNFRL